MYISVLESGLGVKLGLGLGLDQGFDYDAFIVLLCSVPSLPHNYTEWIIYVYTDDYGFGPVFAVWWWSGRDI